MILRYEQAQEVDIETIYTFCKELIEKYETDPIDLEQVLLWCKRKITASLAEYRRILRNGDVVGYFHLCPEEKGTVELDDLYIHEKFRNQGIASALLRELCASADEKGQTLLLYVFKQNEGAWRLYERCGFVVSDEAGGSRWIMTRQPK